MNQFGYVKYPDSTLQIGNNPPVKQLGIRLTGFNRGHLNTNHNHIIFEDIDGIVHVVNKDLFHP